MLYLNDSSNTLISWNIASDSTYIDSLSDATYFVELTDTVRGCAELDTFVVTAPDSLLFTFTQTNFICYKDSNSSIDLSVYGGTPPYSYLWSNGDSVSSLLYISTGNYQALITDSMGCEMETSLIAITSPPEILNTFSIVQDTLGNCQGAAAVNPIGGVHPFDISWSPGLDTTFIIDSLCAGTYIVTITDSDGCQLIDTLEINSLVSLKEDGVNSIYLYPNPARDHLIVEFEEMHYTSLELYNALGKLLSREVLRENRTELEIRNYAAGHYIIVLKADNKAPMSMRFLIE
jgi:hypothetical protein